MAGHRLTRTDIGAWLFRCNPRNVSRLARSELEKLDSWCAADTYRLALVETGDPVILWVTGSAGATPTPGVWAVGHATGRLRRDNADSRLGAANGKGSWQVELRDVSPLATPMPRARIAQDPSLRRMEVLRQPFGPNPSYLSAEETATLRSMIGSWPAPAGLGKQ